MATPADMLHVPSHRKEMQSSNYAQTLDSNMITEIAKARWLNVSVMAVLFCVEKTCSFSLEENGFVKMLYAN